MADQHTQTAPVDTATRQLPEGYAPLGAIDLSRSRVFALLMNVVGLVLIVVFGVLFVRLAKTLRPEFDLPSGFRLDTYSLVALFEGLLVLAALSVVVVLLHEAVHGLFFWVFTASRPKFGFRGAYAYAAAPDWYIPRNQYMLIGLAPFVLLSLLGGMALIPVPESWIWPLIVALTLNASGAVGDLLVVAWLLFKPANALAKDTGDRVDLFGIDD